MAATGYGEAARLNAVWAGESAGEGLVESPMPSQVLPGSAAALLLSPPIASPFPPTTAPVCTCPQMRSSTRSRRCAARRRHGIPSRRWRHGRRHFTSRLTTVGWTMLRPTSRRRSRRAARRRRWRRWRRHWAGGVRGGGGGAIGGPRQSAAHAARQIVATDYVEQHRAAAPPPPPPPPAEEAADEDDLDFDLVTDDGPPDELRSLLLRARSDRATDYVARASAAAAAAGGAAAEPLATTGGPPRAGRSASLEEFVALEQEATAAAAAADDDDDFASCGGEPADELGELLRTLRDQIVATDYVEQQKARGERRPRRPPPPTTPASPPPRAAAAAGLAGPRRRAIACRCRPTRRRCGGRPPRRRPRSPHSLRSRPAAPCRPRRRPPRRRRSPPPARRRRRSRRSHPSGGRRRRTLALSRRTRSPPRACSPLLSPRRGSLLDPPAPRPAPPTRRAWRRCPRPSQRPTAARLPRARRR